ncbi:MAG: DMT family transporter [Candidatus Viridilinea halotolerans]|uniref:DMT family transporter n=1 Tax=Candidatus Viridilinea halotolerans TaxID=2491704 RepID=A0A426TY48_9CHLR|nr:MAG: DMT family transporter [Candidatus Viridilinea halotolerans]
MPASAAAAHPRLVAIIPWVFVLLWSTGFIGARLGLPYIEPFTFLGIRFVIVSTLLAGLALLLRSPWPRSWRALGHIAVAGLLLHGGYLGGVFIAIDNGMPAGISALIVSLQPILTAVIAQPLLGERVAGRQWVGLLLGLLGVGMVVGEKILLVSGVPLIAPISMVGITVALFSTTLGTIYQKRFGGRMPLISGTALQYVAAGIFMIPLALLVETGTIMWTPELLFALVWLVLVLSIGAILLLMLLLRLNSTARVASLFYLVPPSTALQAYFIFGEALGPLALAGMVVASLGVALVVVQ